MGGPHYRNKLKPRFVATIKEDGVYHDGGGLYLQVGESGRAKSWLFRYKRKNKAGEGNMGLGPLHTVDLAEARERAGKARLLLIDDIDPIEQRRAARRAQKLEAAKQTTFAECAKGYLDLHAPPDWSVGSWRVANNRVRKHLLPKLGKLPVAAIDLTAVHDTIMAIHGGKSSTAMRARLDLEAYNACAASGVHYFDRGPLGSGRRRTLGRNRLEKKIWTSRHKTLKKAKRPHLVVLSDPAIAILKKMKATQEADANVREHIFVIGQSEASWGAGQRLVGRPATEFTAISFLKGSFCRRYPEYSNITVHGFRKTFSSWANDEDCFSQEAIETTLAHRIGDKTADIYNQLAKRENPRRLLMDAWAERCGRSDEPLDAKIIPIRADRSKENNDVNDRERRA
jgi:integrase